MLETILIAAVVAVFASFAAHSLLAWESRRELRHLAEDLADLQTSLLSEKRKRAAVASLESRSKRGLTPEDDEAIERALLASPKQHVDEEPWWGGFVKDVERAK